MPHEREKHRQMAAIEARLIRETRMGNIVIGAMATLSAVALALVLAVLLGLVEFPDAL